MNPFPHHVEERFISMELAVKAEHEFNDPSIRWKTAKNQWEFKKSCPQAPGPVTQELFDTLVSPGFVADLADSFGIPNLQADESFRGGGLHAIPPGGYLKLHVDFNRLHDLYRRVNVLLFLNSDWQAEWGGALELWNDPLPRTIAKEIAPHAGVLVAFETSIKSWHGHPHPLRCPPGRERRSIAAYYYSPTPPPGEEKGSRHSTIWMDNVT